MWSLQESLCSGAFPRGACSCTDVLDGNQPPLRCSVSETYTARGMCLGQNPITCISLFCVPGRSEEIGPKGVQKVLFEGVPPPYINFASERIIQTAGQQRRKGQLEKRVAEATSLPIPGVHSVVPSPREIARMKDRRTILVCLPMGPKGKAEATLKTEATFCFPG